MKLAIIGSRTWPRKEKYRIEDYITALPDERSEGRSFVSSDALTELCRAIDKTTIS